MLINIFSNKDSNEKIFASCLKLFKDGFFDRVSNTIWFKNFYVKNANNTLTVNILNNEVNILNELYSLLLKYPETYVQIWNGTCTCEFEPKNLVEFIMKV